MRIVLQRVKEASVEVDSRTVSSIGPGYLIFLCVMQGDTALQAQWLAEKIVKLRLFGAPASAEATAGRPNGKVNDRSLLEMSGEVLVISQFTLAGDTAKGNRPDYTAAASPEEAKILYEYFLQKLRELNVTKVEGGVFGAEMAVRLINDGPVTLMFEK